MFEALAVALGGALGSLGRWQLGVLFKQWIPNLPVGTFAANVVAGLIIGFVTGLDLASPLQPQVKLFLAVGLCGGLSTFCLYSGNILALHHDVHAFGYRIWYRCNHGYHLHVYW